MFDTRREDFPPRRRAQTREWAAKPCRAASEARPIFAVATAPMGAAFPLLSLSSLSLQVKGAFVFFDHEPTQLQGGLVALQITPVHG